MIIHKFTARAAALSALPVLRAQRTLGSTDDRFISVWDGNEQMVEVKYLTQGNKLSIALECLVKTAQHSVDANAILGEIIKLMMGSNRTFDKLAMRCQQDSVEIRYPEEGSNITAIIVIFNVTYETVLGDPYTQKYS